MTYPSLYDKTGDIKDINTLLVPRRATFNPANDSPATALQMAAIIHDRDTADALRYRYLRDTPMDQWPAELLTIVRLQQNAKWDSAIDEALAFLAAMDTNV